MAVAVIRKLLIVPYFGDLPPWFEHWQRNIARLKEYGYDVLLDRDEEGFRKRVKRTLGLDCPLLTGTGKVWDFRPAFGHLYQLESLDYDFWGHTDLDCVYGRVDRWLTDEFLAQLDIYSNHWSYICGCWTLYRNVPAVNMLYTHTPHWGTEMLAGLPTGWAEASFTAAVDRAHEAERIRRAYVCWQTRDLDRFDTLRFGDGGALLEGETEVMLAHFRRTKVYPEGCLS